MTIQHLPFHLERKANRPILGQWHLPQTPPKGTILFLHGYKGHMDWGAWSQVGNTVAHAGWRFLRINFSHNGTQPENPASFVDLEAFAENTHRRELEEANDVVRAIRVPSALHEVGPHQGPLAILGHSRGGGIACLAAAESNSALMPAGIEGVSHLITLASVADFQERFPKGDALKAWEKEGRMEVINHRTRQRLQHNWRFYTDFQAHARRLNIQDAVQRFTGPSLFIHCADDPAVPVEHAHRLAEWSPHPTLFIAEKGGHTFDTKEPWNESSLPAVMQAAMETALRFLEEGRAVQ